MSGGKGGRPRRGSLLVEREHVRMIEGREHFVFALKAREAIRIACHGERQHFD